jgi:hypothetical protein
MAEVTGFVQQVKYDPMLEAALVWIGLTSADTVLCYVRVTATNEPVALVKLGMIEGLTAAMLGGRSVTLSTDDANPSSIESAAIHPVMLGEQAPA